MIAISLSFEPAVTDYLHFLEKGYPQKTILKLVGDRYKLDRSERNMLLRGVVTRKLSAKRKAKLIDSNVLTDQNIYVDMANQLLTIVAYLNGNPVFVSSDGLLRDAGGFHGKRISEQFIGRAMCLIKAFFKQQYSGTITYYLDEQDNLSEIVNDSHFSNSDEQEPGSSIILSKTVDRDLKKLREGIICTADSQIIDNTPLKIFDLARYVLTHHFNPQFFDLDRFLLEKK